MEGENGGGLSAGRSRRSTAGNRMRELLEQERERMLAKQGTEDDEMFQEEEGDVDFEAKVEDVDDIIDSDFDASSDEGAQDGEDELEGEREIEEEERAARKASRVKAAPIGVRKAVAPKPARTPQEGGEPQAAPRPSAKRISFAAGSSPTKGAGIQRSSKRKSTIDATLSIQARLKLEEKRRQEVNERATPKRKKIRLTQADRIAEALEMEEKNRESLKRFLELEEERRERDRRKGKRGIEGPFIRVRSVAEDSHAHLRTKLVHEIDHAKHSQLAKEVAPAWNAHITQDPVFAAREATRKESEAQEGSMREDAPTDLASLAPTEDGSRIHSRNTTTGSDGIQPELADGPTPHSGDSAREGSGITDSIKPSNLDAASAGGHNGSQMQSEGDIVLKEVEMTDPAEVTKPAADESANEKITENIGPAETEDKAEVHSKAAEQDVTMEEAADIMDPPVQETPVDPEPTVPVTAPGPEISEVEQGKSLIGIEEAASPAGEVQVLAAEAEGEEDTGRGQGTDEAARSEKIRQAEQAVADLPFDPETKTYVSLHELPEDTPWQMTWSHVLGSHIDWSHYPLVPARNRPLRPRQSVCPITGLPAVYKDPRNGIAYANKEAYNILTGVMSNRYLWSGRPGPGPEGSEVAPSSSNSNSNNKYEPLEMGCWLDALDESGACHVLDRAAGKPVAGSTEVAPGYRVRGALAPGDEQALVAAAKALPAGTTRSGGRRSAHG